MKIFKSINIQLSDYTLVFFSLLSFFLVQTLFHLLAFHEFLLINSGLYSLRIYLIHFFLALLFSLPVINKHGKWCTFLLLIFLTIICYSNLLYYRAFGEIIPINSYFIFSNLKGFEHSIIPLVSSFDALFILPILLYIAGIYFTKDSNIKKTNKLKIFWIPSIFLIIISPIIITKDTFKTHYREFVGVYNSGLLPRIGLQIYNRIHESSNLTLTEKKLISEYLFLNQNKDNIITNKATKKNLIFILVESLESWPLLQQVNRQEITPNINSYLKKSKTDHIIFFQKVRTQVRGGRSSDAQVIFNTGILPIKDGAVCFQYAYNKFPNLAQEIKEHNGIKKAVTMMGYASHAWNQKEFNPALGFDTLIYEKNYLKDLTITEGLNDRSFLLESADKMTQLPSPYYVQLITLSSHTPFQIPDSCKRLKLGNKKLNRTFADYILSINYVDRAIGEFITKLKKLNLYNQSVIVITGDHNTAQPTKLSEWEEKYASILCGNKAYIPFIVLNAPLSLTYKDEVDQIDLYPTMLDIMGTNAKWKGLGQSLLRKNYKKSLIERDKAIQRSDGKPTIWDISNILISKNYFTKNNLVTNYKFASNIESKYTK